MFRGRRFCFSAPDPDSSPKPEQTSDPTGHSGLRSGPATSVSGESNSKSAEEEPRRLEQTGQEENPNLEEQTIEEEPYREPDNKTELDPLASSTFLRGELWTKTPNQPNRKSIFPIVTIQANKHEQHQYKHGCTSFQWSQRNCSEQTRLI